MRGSFRLAFGPCPIYNGSTMSEDILYLNADAIRSLELSPAMARESIITAFRDHAEGRNSFNPKSSLDLGPGHTFQSMAAASEAHGTASIKWVSAVPMGPRSALAAVNATICISDYWNGQTVAILDGNEITLVRTAGISAAAAAHMVTDAPKTIGMIGCGLQAHAHLAAFAALFPSLDTVIAISRSRGSAEALAEAARQRGMAGIVADDHDTVLAESDIVISMVPGAPGLTPFLDARLTKADAFVAAVDIGRSWLPESLPAFDFLATDSLTQSTSPYDVNGKPVGTVTFDTDLVALCGGREKARPGRRFFCFRGLGLADHAVATLALEQAKARGIGLRLPR